MNCNLPLVAVALLFSLQLYHSKSGYISGTFQICLCYDAPQSLYSCHLGTPTARLRYQACSVNSDSLFYYFAAHIDR